MDEDIIIRYISGEASTDEKIAVEAWIKESSENEKAYKEFLHLWKMSSMLADFKKINVEDSLKKVSSNIAVYKKKSIWEIWKQVAAVLLPVIVIGYSVFFYYSQVKNTTNQVITTFGGNISNFELPDGSKIWLNSNSKITFPLEWKGKQRVVDLIQGEAYFEVKSDEARPFVVRAGNLQVIATGTAFDIEIYDDSPYEKVSLIHGTVDVVVNNRKIRLKPSDMFVYNKKDENSKIVKSDPYVQTSWKDGILVFRDTPIDAVVEKLERYYNVDIIIESRELKNYTFTATISSETIEQVLNLLKIAAPIQYRKEDISNDIEKETFYLSYNK